MKKIIMMVLICCFALTASSVYSVAGKASKISSKFVDEKKPIKKEELPAAVKTTLAGADYKGWEITEAYSVKDDKTEYFEVNLKSADKTMTVKLDKDGKKL